MEISLEQSLLLLVAAGLVESILTGRWVPWYYTVGVPLYRRTLACAPPLTDLPDDEELARRVAGGPLVPLVFRRMAPSASAFREAAWGRVGVGYPTVMHGLVELRGDGRRVVVTGYSNWMWALISLWCIRFGFAELLIGVFAAMYIVQLRRFARVADAVARGAAPADGARRS